MNYRRPAPGEKPRYRFCWLCSKMLYGDKFVFYKDDDASEHITHLECAKRMDGEHAHYNQADQDEMDKAQLKGLEEP